MCWDNRKDVVKEMSKPLNNTSNKYPKSFKEKAYAGRVLCFSKATAFKKKMYFLGVSM